MRQTCSLVFPEFLFSKLQNHLFPGDGDEHGAVIAAGISRQDGKLRLLARDLFLASDGVDYVEGKYGYRMLRAEFIYPLVRYCRDKHLVYLAIHNHGGEDSVSFSADDLKSHERGYPALLDISDGMPVGGLVFARNAVAGDIWFRDGTRTELTETQVIGANIRRLYSSPKTIQQDKYANAIYDRQLQMFGAAGQQILRQATVGVIGAGGVGSLLVEYLSRLGIGKIIVADPDRMEVSNLSRVVGSTKRDVLYGILAQRLPTILDAVLKRLVKKKIDVAKRLVHEANPRITFIGISDSFAKTEVAKRFLGCDFLFLAADTMQARLVFNAIVQQYYIPGIQVGSKIIPASNQKDLESVFSVTRWVLPRSGCLWCSDAISPHQLAIEAKTERERKDQKYGADVANPSVITLNAVGASAAANDFLMSYLGLFQEEVSHGPRRFKHLSRQVVDELHSPEESCSECGPNESSRFGRGDSFSLPTVD